MADDPVFAGTFEHTTQGIPLTRSRHSTPCPVDRRHLVMAVTGSATLVPALNGLLFQPLGITRYPALLTIARAQSWPATDLFARFGMPSLVSMPPP